MEELLKYYALVFLTIIILGTNYYKTHWSFWACKYLCILHVEQTTYKNNNLPAMNDM